MNFCKMSFKNFVWENNPEKLAVTISDKMSADFYPKLTSTVSFVAQQPKIVTGEGVFFGENAYLKINLLEEVFDEKTSGQLFMPSMKPLNAFFTKLEIIGEPKKDCIKYAFTFTQDMESVEETGDVSGSITKVRAGENLFDVVNRTGVSADTIMELNDFVDMFSAREGEQVGLR